MTRYFAERTSFATHEIRWREQPNISWITE